MYSSQSQQGNWCARAATCVTQHGDTKAVDECSERELRERALRMCTGLQSADAKAAVWLLLFPVIRYISLRAAVPQWGQLLERLMP